jgi:TetR/AcrR family transcriptional regulator, transcriptional repressor for nem operon
MARPRNFDKDQVLDAAIGVFRTKGFEGTSTEDLVIAMGIGRQSLYGAFGDKRSLYLEALHRYIAQSIGELVEAARDVDSPIKAVESMLFYFVEHQAAPGSAGCLGVNAICEFGTSDPEVSRIVAESGHRLERTLERLLTDAKAQKELNQALKPKEAAQFVVTALTGMKVAARGGASPSSLRNVAHYTLRSLSA